MLFLSLQRFRVRHAILCGLIRSLIYSNLVKMIDIIDIYVANYYFWQLGGWHDMKYCSLEVVRSCLQKLRWMTARTHPSTPKIWSPPGTNFVLFAGLKSHEDHVEEDHDGRGLFCLSFCLFLPSSRGNRLASLLLFLLYLVVTYCSSSCCCWFCFNFSSWSFCLKLSSRCCRWALTTSSLNAFSSNVTIWSEPLVTNE